MRKLRGFHAVTVPVGIVLTRERRGRWVVLAGDPHVKLDNCHRDGRPHLHPAGWHSRIRRPVRPDLSLGEAVAVLERHFESRGFIDVRQLEEELA